MKFFLMLVLALFVISCSDNNDKNDDKKDTDKCENISCSGFGTCKVVGEEASCICNSGYENGENLTCKKKIEEDLCLNVNCENHKTCNEGLCQLNNGACDSVDDCTENKICENNVCVNEEDNFTLQGVYSLVGNDAVYGTYTGQVEIRNIDNELKVIHLIEYDNSKFEDLVIAQAWIGEVTDAENFKFSATLDRKGFITKYNELTRDVNSPYQAVCDSTFVRDADKLSGAFSCSDAASFDFTETWTRVSDNGERAIWENLRFEKETHEEISGSDKERRFQLYSSFHELDMIAPYTERDDFKRAMHIYIDDKTDYEYYQNNDNKVRVIQKTIDDISLKESKQRRDAFYMTLTKKELVYDNEMQTYFLNESGMYSNYDINNNTFHPSYDGLLWTGVYVASQAMKYIKTDSSTALQNMIKSLNGQIKCFTITGHDSSFARSIRPHEDSAIDCSGLTNENSGDWCKGTGADAGLDYLMFGNNDMFKGYVVAFPWAYLALKKAGGHDALIESMHNVMNKLVKNNEVAGDRKINEFISYVMLYMLETNRLKKLEYKAKYDAAWSLIVDEWLVDQGNGGRYDYGTADWSGTHLNIQTMISLYLIFDEVGDTDKKNSISTGMKNGIENMRFVNQGLYQLAGSTLGRYTSPPEEQDYSIWYLREYIAPKVNVDFDWRINPKFSMSPYPNLPWKNDWTEPNEDRSNSIRSYPLFEKNVDDFMFKTKPWTYKGGSYGGKQGNADYLFAYWFARYFNVIDESN